MSRLNIVREMRDKTFRGNKTKENSKNLRREQGWNDRFILGKMNDYNPKKLNSNFDFIKNNPGACGNRKAKSKGTKRLNYITSASSRKSTNPRVISENNLSNIKYPPQGYMQPQPQKTILNSNDQQMLINELWTNLGVYDEYKQIFSQIADSLMPKEKSEFFQFEIESLRKFEESLVVSFIIIIYFLEICKRG